MDNQVNPNNRVSFLSVPGQGRYTIVISKFLRLFGSTFPIQIEQTPKSTVFYTRPGINGNEQDALSKIFTGLIVLCGSM